MTRDELLSRLEKCEIVARDTAEAVGPRAAETLDADLVTCAASYALDALALSEARAALSAQATDKTGVCAKCGGPHRFDTSVPSHQWNRVIRAAGLPDYLCTSCIVAAFVLAGEGFTAELYGQSDGRADPLSEDASGFDLHGVAIEVRVDGTEMDTVRELRDENNRLRSALGELSPKHPLLAELCRPPAPPTEENYGLR